MREKLLNRILIIFAAALLLSACRSTRNIPDGAPDTIRKKNLIENVQEAENRFNSLRITGSANYRKGDQSQSFKLEIRILKDSLVWVDIADPILGIKVARAVLYKDSVAFVNRMEKEYLTGEVSALKKQIQLDLSFEQVQAMLSANLLFDLAKDFELYYMPGAYLLSDFDPNPKTEKAAAASAEKTVFRQVYIEPGSSKPKTQVMKEPSMGRNATVNLENIQKQDNGLWFPERFQIEFLENGERLQLNYDIRKVEKDDPNLNYPFNIPSSYAEIR